jgi:hypothetical protein
MIDYEKLNVIFYDDDYGFLDRLFFIGGYYWDLRLIWRVKI